ncbi:MAG: hypothetical protein AAGB46_18215 [Verrucomicrobiota bacterium]
MPKLLITGFLPWGPHAANSACEVLRSINPSEFPEWKIERREIPVSWSEVPSAIDACVKATPDVFIALGQYQGNRIRLETTAHNRCDPNKADVDGLFPTDSKIAETAPERLPTALPITEIETELLKKQIPTQVSDDAGDYLCNYLFFHQMLKAEESVSAGFIHLPLLTDWDLAKTKAAVETIVETTCDIAERRLPAAEPPTTSSPTNA